MNPEKIKEDFPIFQEESDLAYLDNAATSQKPEEVINRVEKFYEEENANVGRGLYNLASEITQNYEAARRTVADFINATSSSEIVFVRNTTEAINLVAESLEVEGDIVIPEMAHHSNQLPWRKEAEQNNNSIRWIPTIEGKLDIEAAREIIDKDTAIVSVSHVSNVFGSVTQIEEIAEIAHENDAYILVDGAQSVPRMPVDVKELNVDFLVFSGHKMLGPTGIGVLHGRKELLEQMESYQVGGGMIRSVKKDSVEWEELPHKFEAGTPNIAGALGLESAIEYLEEIGLKKIHKHEQKLARRMMEGLKEIEGVELISPEDEDVSVVSFTMQNAHPHDIAEILSQNNVAIRAGHHCAQPQMEELGVSGTARASPYLYNTEEDVEKFLNAVREVKEVFN